MKLFADSRVVRDLIDVALRKSRLAAGKAFDAYLYRHKAGAATYVPEEVVIAAEAAYAAAGGEGEIDVVGYGNPTHPVCGVTVRRA